MIYVSNEVVNINAVAFDEAELSCLSHRSLSETCFRQLRGPWKGSGHQCDDEQPNMQNAAGVIIPQACTGDPRSLPFS